jgi:ribosomal protein S18 acetylase RimI-like enzyme
VKTLVTCSSEVNISMASIYDLEQLIVLHRACLSANAHIAVALGDRFLRSAYQWLLSAGDGYVLLAKSGGRLIGFSAVANWPYNADLWRRRKWQAVAGLMTHPGLLFHEEFFDRSRLFAPGRAERRQIENAAQIAWTGVESTFQGCGVGKMLRHAAIAESRKRQKSAVFVGMRRKNTAARKLNERVGFVEIPSINTNALVYFMLPLEDPPFRILRLEAHHVEEVVAIHFKSFPNFFLTFLGSAFLRTFYSAFALNERAVAYVAEDSRMNVLGFIVGVKDPPAFFKRLLLRRWWAFVPPSLIAIIYKPGVARRLARALWYRGGRPGNQSRALLSSIAVDPSAQGKHVGSALMERWLSDMRKTGATGCYLTTDTDKNDSVNAFYAKHGWKIESCFHTPEGRRMNRYVYNFPIGEGVTDSHKR